MTRIYRQENLPLNSRMKSLKPNRLWLDTVGFCYWFQKNFFFEANSRIFLIEACHFFALSVLFLSYSITILLFFAWSSHLRWLFIWCNYTLSPEQSFPKPTGLIALLTVKNSITQSQFMPNWQEEGERSWIELNKTPQIALSLNREKEL